MSLVQDSMELYTKECTSTETQGKMTHHAFQVEINKKDSSNLCYRDNSKTPLFCTKSDSQWRSRAREHYQQMQG